MRKKIWELPSAYTASLERGAGATELDKTDFHERLLRDRNRRHNSSCSNRFFRGGLENLEFVTN
jgi:hypothetical protein